MISIADTPAQGPRRRSAPNCVISPQPWAVTGRFRKPKTGSRGSTPTRALLAEATPGLRAASRARRRRSSRRAQRRRPQIRRLEARTANPARSTCGASRRAACSRGAEPTRSRLPGLVRHPRDVSVTLTTGLPVRDRTARRCRLVFSPIGSPREAAATTSTRGSRRRRLRSARVRRRGTIVVTPTHSSRHGLPAIGPGLCAPVAADHHGAARICAELFISYSCATSARTASIAGSSSSSTRTC
jgi:hypothetical protein